MRAVPIGIAAVTAEGAFLCARTILSEAERVLPLERRPEVMFHMQPVGAYTEAMSRGDLSVVTEMLLDSIERLRRAGAAFAIIPANAAHFVIRDVQRRAPIPVLDLVDEVAAECERRGHRRVAILGVRWTMEGGLYDVPLARRGIEAVSPTPDEQEVLHAIITRELLQFDIRKESTQRLLSIVKRLTNDGCDAAALACTELPLCLNTENCGIATVDTTRLLALSAFERSRGG